MIGIQNKAASSLPAKVVATVGTMDGVHVGHAAIVNETVAIARREGGSSLVVTFDPHPREIVQDIQVPLLTTIDERSDVLADLGLDYLRVLKFDQEMASLSAKEFIEQILVQELSVSHVVVGYDHGFGHDREGNATVLRDLGSVHGYTVTEVGEERVDGQSVSSSDIRRLVEIEGKISQAATLLGRTYSLSGTVVEGDKRGREIGFPTANIEIDPQKLIPANGVYKVMVDLGSSVQLGMLNIGNRPTFGSLARSVEVHVIDYDGDLYGHDLKIDFLQRLRSEQKFESVDALIKQLSLDRDRCRGSHITTGE